MAAGPPRGCGQRGRCGIGALDSVPAAAAPPTTRVQGGAAGRCSSARPHPCSPPTQHNVLLCLLPSECL